MPNYPYFYSDYNPSTQSFFDFNMLALRIKLLPRYLLLLLMSVISITAVAQATSDNHDPVYGFDPFLYNGRIYYFYPPPGTSGTQYLLEEFDPHGTLTVRGITYSNLTLNYDIYNQQLIMKYQNSLGSPSLVAISDAWLDSFTLGDKYFEIISEASNGKRIYQVLGNGNEKVMYYQNREMLIDNAKSYKNYYFSDIRMKKYLFIEGNLTSFNTNRNFVKAFKPAVQDLIMKYIRKNRIDVKKANSIIMTDLINYCNTLTGL